ncbi:WLM domain-containing protein [Filobasidium floriforme]|uniref:WLM domain-containing protein n=1 Tax=Filobasidium floriforme TaxID=5210 RepID=UPI001E8D848D|nr:WLM domain-containing protein [Filobasidium floriforme]KAH8081874.1 WLM domain-containing protein [Filobasidium floriforme]
MPNLGAIGRKINAREVDPNPHILFTSVLERKPNAEQALRMMKALAAQVRPLMQRHGIKVNSFEEYPFNKVFAGRNWNAGEVVEIVLRRPDNSFLPMSYLERTMTHELAHCHQMNHGPDFQALWSRLQGEVYHLQRDGYFGDGFYSEGRRLGDSVPISSAERADGQVPELVCGGANKRSAPSKASRGYGGGKRRRGQALINGVASTSSGAQTAKKRKSSRPNKKAFEDKAGGNRLDGLDGEDLPDIKTIRAKVASSARQIQLMDGGSLAAAKRAAVANLEDVEREILEGTSVGKRARTKSAAEMRAEAAERRIKALNQPQPSPQAQGVQAGPSKIEDDASEDVDELEDSDELDELDDTEEAEFGPDAVLTMFGNMSVEEREAMKGDVKDEPVETGFEDPGPCGLIAAREVDHPERSPDPEFKTESSAATTSKRTIAPIPSSSPGTFATLAKPPPKNAAGPTPTFSAKSLVEGEKARLRLHQIGQTLGSQPQDIRFWQCDHCGQNWHRDYGRCGSNGCTGVNPGRNGPTKLNARPPSPIIISDDDEW